MSVHVMKRKQHQQQVAQRNSSQSNHAMFLFVVLLAVCLLIMDDAHAQSCFVVFLNRRWVGVKRGVGVTVGTHERGKK